MRIIDLIDILKDTYGSTLPTKIIGLRPGEKIHEIMLNESEFARAFEFKDLLVVTPSLSHWFENHIETKPLYMLQGTPLKNKIAKEYSSGDETLSKADLRDLLIKYGLLI
jgi:FlaA1/EpsC-like NDP-sugar epimerase